MSSHQCNHVISAFNHFERLQVQLIFCHILSHCRTCLYIDQAWRSSDVPGNLMRPGPGSGEPRPSRSEDTENLLPRDWALSISQACIVRTAGAGATSEMRNEKLVLTVCFG